MLRHLPNVLSGLRLAAAPVTAALLLAGHFTLAFAIFAAAGLSDAIDGYLAKRYGGKTHVGRYLDPAADKALMLAVFATLAVLQIVPAWLAFVVIARDILIVSAVAVALLAGAPLRVAPLFIGKLSTVLQVVYIGLHLAAHAFSWPLDMFAPSDAYVVGAVTIASAFAYGRLWFAAMRARAFDAT